MGKKMKRKAPGAMRENEGRNWYEIDRNRYDFLFAWSDLVRCGTGRRGKEIAKDYQRSPEGTSLSIWGYRLFTVSLPIFGSFAKGDWKC